MAQAIREHSYKSHKELILLYRPDGQSAMAKGKATGNDCNETQRIDKVVIKSLKYI